MFRLFIVILASFAICACSSQVEPSSVKRSASNSGLTCQNSDSLQASAIYETDNRLDWFEAPGLTTAYWAKATLALMHPRSLQLEEDSYLIKGPSYEKMAGLCPGHPFAKQPTAAFCSGFLVSEDLIVTAGHCVRSQAECDNTKFVFDFATFVSGQREHRVGLESVYSCGQIVRREVGAVDYAVIRLDRAVQNRVPLNLRRQGSVSVGEQVMLIGHPMGLPSKISDGGFILSQGQRIMASVDAFAANSGSPVVNSITGRVEGILVSGEKDFDYSGDCRVEALCDNNCRGEGVTPIFHVLEVLTHVQDYPNPVCEN